MKRCCLKRTTTYLLRNDLLGDTEASSSWGQKRFWRQALLFNKSRWRSQQFFFLFLVRTSFPLRTIAKRGTRVLIGLHRSSGPDQGAGQIETVQEDRDVGGGYSVLEVVEWATKKGSSINMGWIIKYRLFKHHLMPIGLPTTPGVCRETTLRRLKCWRIHSTTTRSFQKAYRQHRLNSLVVLLFLACRRYVSLISSRIS